MFKLGWEWGKTFFIKNLTKHNLNFDKKLFYSDKKFLHTDKIFSHSSKSQEVETPEPVQVHVESQSEVEEVEVAVELEDRSHNRPGESGRLCFEILPPLECYA